MLWNPEQRFRFWLKQDKNNGHSLSRLERYAIPRVSLSHTYLPIIKCGNAIQNTDAYPINECETQNTHLTELKLRSEENILCFHCAAQLHSGFHVYTEVCKVLDVRGSVHHSIIHVKNPTGCNSVSKFYFKFMWSSTCFGRHPAHHQEPKTALATSGFAYVEGCWPCSCWTLSASSNYKANNPLHMQNLRVLV